MSDKRLAAIEARGLHKSFGETLVLDGIDLTVATGSVYALLGPNGAGKTTTVRILSTLLKPDAGTVRVAGHDIDRHPDRVRAAIGVTGQFSAVDGWLTGEENLLLMADLKHLTKADGRRRTTQLLETMELSDAAKRQVTTYSGGMRRRLDLAMTLIGDPQIIFLDEPTTGLDPRSRRAMWEIVRKLTNGGVTILLTTQYLEEADKLADHVALLDGGKIVAEGTPQQLKSMIPGGHVTLHFSDESALQRAALLFGTAAREPEELALHVPSSDGVHSLRALLGRLDSESIEVESLSVHSPDLDDVFLALTGSAGREASAEYSKEVAR